MDGIDINPIFEEPGAHSAKTLKTQHQIIVKELTTPLVLGCKQTWDLIHRQLGVFVSQNLLTLVPNA
jgi:hypothetical protein